MRLSVADLDRLAALLVPAAGLVASAAQAEALTAPPSSADPVLWSAWLAQLGDDPLARLLLRLPANPEFLTLIALLRPPPAPGVEAPHLVLNGLPVVDRRDVWAQLLTLQGGTRRILEISGTSGAGKTHVRWQVQALCAQDVFYFDLDGNNTLRYIATDILSQIAPNVKLRDRDLADSTDSAWARSVAGQVFAALTAPPATVRWLIFDHLERTQRADETIVFFKELAERFAAAGGKAHLPRLVLIDHGVPLTYVTRLQTQKVPLSPVTRSDVEHFARKIPTWAPTEGGRIYDDARAEADALLATLRAAVPGETPRDPFMGILFQKITERLEQP